MARSALVDTGFLVALLSRNDRHHRWAAVQAPRVAPPWISCEAVLSPRRFISWDAPVGRGWPSCSIVAP